MEAAFQVLAAEVKSCYEKTWHDWYQGQERHPARLRVEINDTDSATYNTRDDVIFLALRSGDVEDYASMVTADTRAEERQWRIWKQELVHEMLHEYQHKMLLAPSAEGIRLHETDARGFDGQGHDDLFYTAIAEKARYFSMRPEEFRDKL